MKRILILTLLLSGCAINPKMLENRLACTADGTELYAVSKWGPMGLSTQIAAADAKAVCKQP